MVLKPRLRLILIVLAIVALVSLAAFFGLRKSVTLRVDGSSRTLTTYALRVTDLLVSQGIAVAQSDKITPGLNAWLKNRATVTLVRAIPVQVLADGVVSSILSAERSPSALLLQAGIQTQPGDVVLSDGKEVAANLAFPDNASALSLQVIRSVRFTLVDTGSKKTLYSAAPTLGRALWAAGYALYAADQLDPPAGTPLTPDLVATLTRSRPVSIQTASGVISFRTAAHTVGQALEAAHLSLQGLDYSLPAADQPIPSNGKLRLVRVSEQVLIDETPVPFETEFQADADLELDSQAVVQAGEYGVQAQRVRVRYEDGVEASRKVESEWLASEPQKRIIGYGTALVMHTATVDGVTIQYWRVLTMYATSYHPSEVGDTTASGMPLKKGVAAIDRSLVPFYTRMYIPGYGEAVAADTGGGVIGRWIDLGYSDSDYVPWHSWVTVYFLWPPPDNIVWVIP